MESAATGPSTAPRVGPMAALMSALLFGVTLPVAKRLLEDGSPLLIAGLLYLGSGAGLGLLRLVQDRAWRPTGFAGADWAWLALATALGGIVAPALLMFGLSGSDAATASLFLNLEAVFTATLAWFVFREATSRRVVLGFLAILAGASLLAWPSGPVRAGNTMGLLEVAAACLCWGLDNNVTRRISAGDARLIAGIKGLAAGGASTLCALSLGAHLPQPLHVAESLVLGFLGYGLSLVLFIVALRHLGTARTCAYFSTAPFLGALLAVEVYGEPVAPLFIAATLLMLVGVWLHVTERHEHVHVHEHLIHTHTHRHDEHHRHAHAADWDGVEPHTHEHRHEPLRHSHPHFPDIHHQHTH